jgi:hypothetical protein
MYRGTKTWLILLLLSASCYVHAGDTISTHFIKVHFLYGSKPARGYKNTEKKWFGGFHGGHVSIEVDNEVIGFVPRGELHIFAHRREKNSSFVSAELQGWVNDTAGLKYTSVTIPVTADQYRDIKSIHAGYLQSPPYDYAFFGMRCAAATYDILGRLQLVERRSNSSNIFAHFYPKPLRKKMLRLSKERGYTITSQRGRTSRKWEKD